MIPCELHVQTIIPTYAIHLAINGCQGCHEHVTLHWLVIGSDLQPGENMITRGLQSVIIYNVDRTKTSELQANKHTKTTYVYIYI